MKICDDNHEEIVYDSKNCPLCEAFQKIKDLESEIEDLEDRND